MTGFDALVTGDRIVAYVLQRVRENAAALPQANYVNLANPRP